MGCHVANILTSQPDLLSSAVRDLPNAVFRTQYYTHIFPSISPSTGLRAVKTGSNQRSGVVVTAGARLFQTTSFTDSIAAPRVRQAHLTRVQGGPSLEQSNLFHGKRLEINHFLVDQPT